jgi:virginiamycin B lyase
MSHSTRMKTEPESRVRGVRRSGLAFIAALGVVVTGTLTAEAGGLYGYKEFKIPTEQSEPRDITAGSDGNLWFVEGRTVFDEETFEEHQNIGRITPSGDVTEFRVDCSFCLDEIEQGPNDTLYFTTNSTFQGLGSITTAGDIGFVNPNDGRYLLENLTRDGDNVWGSSGTTLWRYTPQSGEFVEFTLPVAAGEVDVAADGIVWHTADGAIGSFDPQTGASTLTPVPNSVTPGGQASTPGHVAIATDGKVWFTDRLNDSAGYLDPHATTLRVTQFSTVTTESGDSGPQDIAAADDGSMWFALAEVGNVAQITPNGVITEVGKGKGDDPDTGLEQAFGVAFLADPDGPEGPGGDSVWFTQQAYSKIARVTEK